MLPEGMHDHTCYVPLKLSPLAVSASQTHKPHSSSVFYRIVYANLVQPNEMQKHQEQEQDKKQFDNLKPSRIQTQFRKHDLHDPPQDRNYHDKDNDPNDDPRESFNPEEPVVMQPYLHCECCKCSHVKSPLPLNRL